MELINLSLVISRLLTDLVLRIKFKLQKLLFKVVPKSSIENHDKKSDSQGLGYESKVSKLITDKRLISKFRRNFEYRMILEHVSYRQGLEYLDRIFQLEIIDSSLISKLAQNDNFGNPRRYYYSGIGWVSPTLLRYISVFSEIEKLIGFKSINSIVEIGIGYGGQARVIYELSHVTRYDFYDLSDVQQLASTYLKKTCPEFSPNHLDIYRVENEQFDLVISNYAISELPVEVQKEYLEKILEPAAHCYLIMNSGASNKTGRSLGKLSQKTFLASLPGSQILPEVPLTGPDNYVLTR